MICKYFLPLPRLYFYFLIMSFDVLRLKFWWSFSLFLLLRLLLVLHLMNHCQIEDHEAFPLFFSKSFIVLALSFRFSLYVELILLCGMKRGVTLFICLWISSCSNTTVERLFFPIKWTLHPCQKSIDCKCKGFFLDSQLCSCNLHIYPHASINLSWLP